VLYYQQLSLAKHLKYLLLLFYPH